MHARMKQPRTATTTPFSERVRRKDELARTVCRQHVRVLLVAHLYELRAGPKFGQSFFEK